MNDDSNPTLTGWPLAAFGMFVVGCVTAVVIVAIRAIA